MYYHVPWYSMAQSALLSSTIGITLFGCYKWNRVISCYTLQIVIPYYHASYHIKSHHIIPYHIISHDMTSDHITSYHITSHHITSHDMTSDHITSHRIIPYHIISYHIDSCYRKAPHSTRIICATTRQTVVHSMLLCTVVYTYFVSEEIQNTDSQHTM